MVDYVVQASCWLTDAHGVSRLYGAGETVKMFPKEAYWLILSGQIKQPATAKPSRKSSKAAEPAAE